MGPLAWMTDPNLCGRTFGGPTWLAGRTLVAAIFGEPMAPEMQAIYRQCSGRTVAPVAPVARATIAAGRGSGKTLLASFMCVYLAASRDFHRLLGPGELATVMLIAPDRKQARVAFRYVRGLLAQSPLLARLIIAETRDSITLSTGAIIEIHTANPGTMRGYGLGGLVIDEAAFLPTNETSANPDVEIERAALPALARVPGSLLLTLSTAYAKRGVLWEHIQRFHGVDGAPVLTWQAPTRVMNPTISEQTVADALSEDECAARAEWLAEFRDDLESYVSSEVLRAVTIPGRGDLPPVGGRRYTAFTDPSGGGGGKFADSFATAVAHQEGAVGVVDALLEIRPPFDPDAAVAEVAALLAGYGVRTVHGDKFAGEWPTSRFAAHHVRYQPSELSKSELFLECLPLLTGRRVELPDHARLLNQFAGLDRRRGAQGRDAIQDSGRRGAHDDLANVAAGALVTAAAGRGRARPMSRVGVGTMFDGGRARVDGGPVSAPRPSTPRHQDVAALLPRWR